MNPVDVPSRRLRSVILALGSWQRQKDICMCVIVPVFLINCVKSLVEGSHASCNGDQCFHPGLSIFKVIKRLGMEYPAGHLYHECAQYGITVHAVSQPFVTRGFLCTLLLSWYAEAR